MQTNFRIIAGGFESCGNSRAAAATLKTALVSHLGASIPSIAFKTGMSELSYLKQATESGLETAVNAIQQETSVVFLDLFRKDRVRPQSTVDESRKINNSFFDACLIAKLHSRCHAVAMRVSLSFDIPNAGVLAYVYVCHRRCRLARHAMRQQKPG